MNDKLKIGGEIFVLESDGTPIDEKDIMIELKKHVFLLLQKKRRGQNLMLKLIIIQL